MPVRIYNNYGNKYKQSNSSKYGSMDSSRAFMLLQENLKRCLSFGRIPIDNNKDNNNGKVSCSRKNTTKGTVTQNFG